MLTTSGREPLVRWSLVTDTTERSRSGPRDDMVGVGGMADGVEAAVRPTKNQSSFLPLLLLLETRPHRCSLGSVAGAWLGSQKRWERLGCCRLDLHREKCKGCRSYGTKALALTINIYIASTLPIAFRNRTRSLQSWKRTSPSLLTNTNTHVHFSFLSLSLSLSSSPPSSCYPRRHPVAERPAAEQWRY